jgi:hypothetical protein
VLRSLFCLLAALAAACTQGGRAVPTGDVAAPGPVGQDSSLATDEDTPVSGQLAADVGGDGAPSYGIAQAPAHGDIALDSATGAFTYTPEADWSGEDLLVWRAYLGELDTGPHTVALTVRPVQDPPVALGDALAGPEDFLVETTLGGLDPDGDPLVFALVAQPAHGVADLTADGALTWTPDADYFGSDALSFTVSDGIAVSAPAEVTLTLSPTPDAPIAVPAAAIGPEDTLLELQIAASDPDGDPLVYTLLSAPVHGTASVIRATGAASYLPAADFAGDDAFVVLVSDDTGASAVAPVSIEITPVNDAPLALAGAIVTSVGIARDGAFAAVDVDGDPLSFAIQDPPAHGVVSGLVGADFTYTPDAGFSGEDSFTFVADDGIAISSPATVTVTVTGADQADTDGDGLQDALELTLGTDPFSVDTDGDTVPDGGELLVLFSDPRVDESGPCAPPWTYGGIIAVVATPMALFAADLDADGDQDVLSAALFGPKAAWQENLGGGQFAPPANFSPALTGGTSVAAADLDGDGDLDALSTSANDDRVSWYENLGGGAFGAEQVIDATADYAAAVTTADLDADGDADVVAASFLDDTVGWYANLGAGVFGAKQIVTTTADGVDALDVADFDGDGDLDLVSGAYKGGEVTWYANQGGGVFGAAQFLAVAPGAESVRAADLDGDGLPEILTVAALGNQALLLRNLGGTFAAPEVLDAALSTPTLVAAADLDGDGDLDVVVTDTGNDRVQWYDNVGGALGPPQLVGNTLAAPWWVLAADLDGDGAKDVLTDSLVGSVVFWYGNQLAPSDTDGDRMSDAAEDCISLTDPAAADTDGGGVDDFAELLRLTDPSNPLDG